MLIKNGRNIVQFNLEQIIPIWKRGKEIKDIIKKRSNFKYALKRRTRVKGFLKYIEYEMNLEKLRKMSKA
ncbi:hypothetical protein Glove_281g46 [Diversispora epigaea]|uniref:U3 small nucleolar RNA-associated protein 6 N-terminal domain-containing protein n=1 Tax=Diversispora epigaea TaxID=1348612 RepID=A0A397I8F0_9GLOM|nr:hypothetical protein Glove_281g46 [Diversispora epigaea]